MIAVTKDELSEPITLLEAPSVYSDDASLRVEHFKFLSKTSTPPSAIRKVRFSPEISVTEIEARSDDPSKKNALYLSATDMKNCRSDAKSTAKHFRSNDKVTVQLLDQGYRQASRVAFDNNDEYYKYMQNHQIIDAVSKASLKEWCSKTWSGRGLERYCSPKQRIERPHIAMECREAVLRLSTQNISDQQLAQFYHEYSRPMAVFSRLIGHADQLAASHAATERQRIRNSDVVP